MLKRVDIFGINYTVADYSNAVDQILFYLDMMKHPKATQSGYGVTALAVHGLIEGHNNPELKKQINEIDMVVPDGQPVRWAMNWFHKT